tara:strand:+ start:44923 stop:45093 length:171 start_codon:yes stop_codon:yes gene_type:complete
VKQERKGRYRDAGRVDLVLYDMALRLYQSNTVKCEVTHAPGIFQRQDWYVASQGQR